MSQTGLTKLNVSKIINLAPVGVSEKKQEKPTHVSCNDRQDVKNHPNPHVYTPNIVPQKSSAVNLYIQINPGSTPKRHYTFNTRPLFFMISYVKTSLKLKKYVRVTWGEEEEIITLNIVIM